MVAKDKPTFNASHHVMTGTVLVILFVSSFSTINNSILPIRAVAAACFCSCNIFFKKISSLHTETFRLKIDK